MSLHTCQPENRCIELRGAIDIARGGRYANEMAWERRSGPAPKIGAREVDTTKLLGLERRFWKRSDAGQGGTVTYYEKSVGDVRARVVFDSGIYLGDPKSSARQKLDELVITRGGKPIALTDVDAPLRSELLVDIESLE